MIAPVCVKCGREMRCEKNGQLVNDPAVDGFPATYWAGDKFRCPECGCEIVTGFSKNGHSAEDMTAMGRNVAESVEFRYRKRGWFLFAPDVEFRP
jgi:hypothetical protein